MMNEYGFILVNANRFLSSNEPQVLVLQVGHMFYIDDPIKDDWHVIIKNHHVTSITRQKKIHKQMMM